MKTFLRYLSIFSHPPFIPLFVLLSFFVPAFVLLVTSNQEISLYVQGVLSEDKVYQQQMTFTLSALREGDIQKIQSEPHVAYIRMMKEDMDKEIMISSPPANLRTKERQLLEKVPMGALAPFGYKKNTGRAEFVFDGHTIAVAGETGSDFYSEQGKNHMLILPETFVQLAISDVQVRVSWKGIPTAKAMEEAAETWKSQGLQITDIQIPNFEKILQENKNALLFYQLLVFLFLILNVLFVFHYILQTSKRTLSIFRILGLSRTWSALLITGELVFYHVMGFALATVAAYTLVVKRSIYFSWHDIALFFVLATLVVLVLSFGLASLVLARMPLSTVKENIHAA